MEFTIREMQKNDINAVQEVATASWNYTYKGIIPNEIQQQFLTYAYSKEMMEKRLKNSAIFVSEVDEKIIGFINLSPLKQSGVTELIAIYLLPEYHHRRIGTDLLEKGILFFKEVNEVITNVEQENIIGMNFYTSKGFQIVSEFDEDFNGHILKTVSMSLKLK